jgi:hypothetical protein
MNEEEKVTWKVAVQRECEDTDDYINKKLEDYAHLKEDIKNTINGTK